MAPIALRKLRVVFLQDEALYNGSKLDAVNGKGGDQSIMARSEKSFVSKEPSRLDSAPTQSSVGVVLAGCAFGLYWAWLTLNFYLEPAAPVSVDGAWMFGSAGHSVALLLFIVLPDRFSAIVTRRKTIALNGVLVAVGTILPLLDWTGILGWGAASIVLVCSGWLVTGVGTAALVVAWGSYFIRFDSRQVLACNAIALLEASTIHFLMFSAIAPILAAVMAFLPLASAGSLIALKVNGSSCAAVDYASAESGGSVIKRFSPRTFIPLGGMFFFAFCGELLRNAASSDVGVTEMGLLYNFGLFLGALLILVSEYIRKGLPIGRRGLFGRLRALFMTMALSLMVSAVFDLSFGFAYLCYAVGFAGLRVYAWVVAIDLARTLHLNARKVVSAMILSFSLGPLLVSLISVIVPLEGELWNDVALVLVFGTFVVAMELLDRDNYRDAWGLSDENIVAAEERANAVMDDVARAMGEKAGEVADSVFDELSLTPREREVAKLLVEGRSLPYVADALQSV